MIDRTHDLPVTRQCQILNLARSTVYSEPAPIALEDLDLYQMADSPEDAWDIIRRFYCL